MPPRAVKAGVKERYAIDVQRAITTVFGMGLAKRNIGDDSALVADKLAGKPPTFDPVPEFEPLNGPFQLKE